MRIMSFNLRFDNPEDGKNSWVNRKKAVKKVLNDVEADIIGIQEGLPAQIKQLKEWLKNYNYFGRGRKKSGAGEQVAIFYKKDNYKVLDKGHFWLSSTPEIPGSKSFGNKVVRMASWLILKDKIKSQKFVFLNTHLDHDSLNARLKGVELIASFLNENRFKNKIVTGDFNALPNSEPILNLEKKAEVDDIFAKKDNDLFTFHNFGQESENRIDFIFSSQNIKTKKMKVIKEKPFDIYPSDHYPILADLDLS